MRIDDVDAIGFETNMWSLPQEAKTEFHKAIFTGIDSNALLTGKEIVVLRNGLPAKRVAQTFRNYIHPIKSPEVSGRVEANISWGGKEGTTVDYSARVEARTDQGSVDVTAKVDNEGRGSVSAGAEVNTKSDDTEK